MRVSLFGRETWLRQGQAPCRLHFKSVECRVCTGQALLTACCSAMPTSKVRSGKLAEKRLRPVPPPIAAWMPTIRESRSASASSASAK